MIRRSRSLSFDQYVALRYIDRICVNLFEIFVKGTLIESRLPLLIESSLFRMEESR